MNIVISIENYNYKIKGIFLIIRLPDENWSTSILKVGFYIRNFLSLSKYIVDIKTLKLSYVVILKWDHYFYYYATLLYRTKEQITFNSMYDISSNIMDS